MAINPQPLKHPQNLNPNPTNDQDADYASDGKTPQRVMHLNLGFFKHRTNDKAHGAAIVLALMLLVIMLVVYFLGNDAYPLKDKVVMWLGNAFFLSQVSLLAKMESAMINKLKL